MAGQLGRWGPGGPSPHISVCLYVYHKQIRIYLYAYLLIYYARKPPPNHPVTAHWHKYISICALVWIRSHITTIKLNILISVSLIKK